ncbi:spermine synthase [Thauera linaloolentis]|uniref:Spermine synthase n=1 Tax=Thauera linaloolentis (strain DSM 12138 / JCM 21573 / CCUG 41526 / CIP 105981 / IAM 15112 / NBRC 102519 / 47Lol) TaxID=1123367 RepID=N6XZG9_THAL4|nr:spermine synthase [Thauera linaloolentis]ENO84660.1 spermine synthase [Thauera linaloolentis 47Lol = DSM 12138]MCM8566554.1 spermidine synthase [Thauera linaloolentis]
MNTPIDISEEAGVRYLHFGSDWVQGAMRIRKPNALELAYTREMMAGLLLRDGLADDAGRWPKKVLIIGLGAASLAKFVYHHCPQARIKVVEIAPTVIAAARQFFKLPEEDARFSIHVGCGAQYVLEKDGSYDYVLLDGFDRNARAGVLDTLPFYQALRSRLSAQGLVAVNLFGRSRGYKASIERILQAFDDRAVAFPSCDSGNVVAFAAAGEPVERPLGELRERARLLKAATGLDLGPTITRLEQSGSVPGGVLHL